MNIRENDLFESLETCDMLTDGWERERCYGGVFMENVVNRDNPAHPSKYLEADQPLYPCDVVEPRYKNECYQRQTSYVLETQGNDFSRVFDLCATAVEEDFRPSCYQGLGWDAAVPQAEHRRRERGYQHAVHAGRRLRGPVQLYRRSGRILYQALLQRHAGQGVLRVLRRGLARCVPAGSRGILQDPSISVRAAKNIVIAAFAGSLRSQPLQNRCHCRRILRADRGAREGEKGVIS